MFHDLTKKHQLEDQPGIGAVLTLTEWFKKTNDISTLQEFTSEHFLFLHDCI